MKVEYYYSRATGIAPETDAVIEEAMKEAGVVAEIEHIEVGDDGDARKQRFLGSPTVRINGFDVEYQEREPPEYHSGRRFYSTASGWKPYPKPEQLVRLLQEQKEREERRA